MEKPWKSPNINRRDEYEPKCSDNTKNSFSAHHNFLMKRMKINIRVKNFHCRISMDVNER
jgi:hypothetical protein